MAKYVSRNTQTVNSGSLAWAFVALGGLWLYFDSRKPKIDWAGLPFDPGTITFSMSANGEKWSGVKRFTDKTETVKTIGKIKFIVSTDKDGFTLTIKDAVTNQILDEVGIVKTDSINGFINVR